MTNPNCLEARARCYGRNLPPADKLYRHHTIGPESSFIDSLTPAEYGGYDVWGTYDGAPLSSAIIPVAKVTHAQGYLHEGLATEEAVTMKGVLRRQVDKWKDTPAQIYVSRNPEELLDTATLRIGTGTFDSLPTTQLMLDAIYPEELERLQAKPEGSVRELGAFAKSRFAHQNHRTRGVATIIREVFRDTIGKDLTLYCSMVSPSREKYEEILSPDNLAPIGDPVVLERNEYRSETALIPLVIIPEQFLPNIIKGIATSKEQRVREKLIGSLLFFTEGISLSDLTPYVEEQTAETVGKIRTAAMQHMNNRTTREPVPA